jgi:hypothetical protein
MQGIRTLFRADRNGRVTQLEVRTSLELRPTPARWRPKGTTGRELAVADEPVTRTGQLAERLDQPFQIMHPKDRGDMIESARAVEGLDADDRREAVQNHGS